MKKPKLWLKPEHFDCLHIAALANGGIGNGAYFDTPEGWDAMANGRFDDEGALYRTMCHTYAPRCAVGLIRWAGDGRLSIEGPNDDATFKTKRISFEEWVKRTNADIHPKALPDGRLPDGYDQSTGEELKYFPYAPGMTW